MISLLAPMSHQPESVLGGYQRRSVTALSVGVAAFLLAYVFSLWYLRIYYLGDQEHYTRFYNSLFGVDPQHWAMLQRRHLGAAEPLYRYIVGIPAYFGFDRVQYLSLWNGVFASSIAYVCVRLRCSLLFGLFLFTNYYFIVLLGSAERLKFAYIMFSVAICVSSVRLRYFLALCSMFFHAQAAVQLASTLGYYFYKNSNAASSTPARSLLIFSAVIASASIVAFLFLRSIGDVLMIKSEGYMARSSGAEEIIQWGVLLAAGSYIFRDKAAFIVGMLPMGIFTLLYGNRVNVATFAFFAIMALVQRKTNHPIVLAAMAYMSFKSIPFVFNVVQYGTGYP